MDQITIVDRVRSIVTGTPFSLTEAPEPFDFQRLPDHVGDAVRVLATGVAVTGLFSWAEERQDDLEVEVALRHTGTPADTVRSLSVMASSLTAAVLRDGLGDGDYGVDDEGRRAEITQPAGAAYASLRLTIPVRYLAAV